MTLFQSDLNFTFKVKEWLYDQQKLYGVPLTYEVAERERRQQRSRLKRDRVRSEACRQLDFDQPTPPDESHSPSYIGTSVANKSKVKLHLECLEQIARTTNYTIVEVLFHLT